MNIKVLEQLTALAGICGREDAVADFMYHHFLDLYSDVTVDRIGNVICHIPGRGGCKRRMLIFAHMDEIGFIIRRVEPDGFLRVERIGGVSTQILPGTFVHILGKRQVTGVFGTPSHHFIRQEDKFTVPPVNELYIDIGAASAEEVEKLGIHPGTVAVFDGTLRKLSDDVICSRAMDDRAGCAVLLEVARVLKDTPPEWEIYLVAAVMEEFNIRGIMPAVRKIQPEVSVGIDVTPSCDTPDMDYNDIALGKGPALTQMNFHGRGTLAGVLPDEKLLAYLEHICKEKQIPFQWEVAPGVITENAFLLFENEGISVANVSIPTRYTHTPFECVSKRDIERVLKLMVSLAAETTAEEPFGKERG